MKALRILPEAEEELVEAARWYQSKRLDLGIELVAFVERALEEVVDAPLACPIWRAGSPYRAKQVRRFPYVVLFRIEGELVVVVAVAHTRRRPGYWAGR